MELYTADVAFGGTLETSRALAVAWVVGEVKGVVGGGALMEGPERGDKRVK